MRAPLAAAPSLDLARHPAERARILASLAAGERHHFPALRPESFEVAAPRSPLYNCVAASVGETQRHLEPGLKLSQVDAFYAARGFAPRERLDLRVEAGVDKVLVFALRPDTLAWEKLKDEYEERGREHLLDEGPIFRHAVRQQPDGSWLSKNGREGPLLRVLDPAALGGPLYGVPVRLYTRVAAT